MCGIRDPNLFTCIVKPLPFGLAEDHGGQNMWGVYLQGRAAHLSDYCPVGEQEQRLVTFLTSHTELMSE